MGSLKSAVINYFEILMKFFLLENVEDVEIIKSRSLLC